VDSFCDFVIKDAFGKCECKHGRNGNDNGNGIDSGAGGGGESKCQQSFKGK
jgi:hypothetical protein